MTGKANLSPSWLSSLLFLVITTMILPGNAAALRPPSLDSDYLYITTSEYDYSGGNYALMDARPPYDMYENQGLMSTDNQIFYYDGLIYAVNGFGFDNIQVIDPVDFSTIRQFTTGAGSNPQQICFVSSERAFITRYETCELWEVNPATGATTDIIDLSNYADNDGIPEMYSMAIANGLLYVTIQRLDRNNYWNPVGTSFLAVIDLSDNSLRDMDSGTPGIQGILLARTNPNCSILIDPTSGEFLIAEMGAYGILDGGIERFDPQTHQSHGLVVTEADLGGDIKDWVTAADGTSFAITLSPSWTTSLIAFDRNSGEINGPLASVNESAYFHLAIDDLRRELYLSDRTYTNPGIRIYNIDLLIPLVDNPISTGLYPSRILTMAGPASGVDQELVAVRPGSSISAWPQPSAGQVYLRCKIDSPAIFSIDIHDLSGRIVANLEQNQILGGEEIISWDGRDNQHNEVVSGFYLARFKSADSIYVRKIQVIN